MQRTTKVAIRCKGAGSPNPENNGKILSPGKPEKNGKKRLELRELKQLQCGLNMINGKRERQRERKRGRERREREKR